MIRISTGKPKPILRKKRIKRQISPVNKSSTSNNTAGAAPPLLEPKRSNSLRFAGPIKIIVVDPKSEYCKTVWCAIGIALTNVTIGAVLIITLLYSIHNGDAHVVVFTFAFHFFAAEAILALHYANGWTAPMRTRHRKFAHFFLHMCGIVCAIVGVMIVLTSNGISDSSHCIIGLVTGSLILLSALFGPIAYSLKKRSLIILHMSIGIPAFILSSLCVCFGLVTDSFKSLVGEVVVNVLIALVIFYTVFIITSSFIKCMSRVM